MWPARSAVPPACAKSFPCGSTRGHILFAVPPAPSANCHEWLASNRAHGCLRDLQGQRSFCSASAGQLLFRLGEEHACHRYFSDTQHPRQHNASNCHLTCECACISGSDVGLGEGGVAAQRSSHSPVRFHRSYVHYRRHPGPPSACSAPRSLPLSGQHPSQAFHSVSLSELGRLGETALLYFHWSFVTQPEPQIFFSHRTPGRRHQNSTLI